jgi:putative molybdopterin biosynthesis protein
MHNAAMNQSYETQFLTTKEVAKLLKVNEKMVYSLVNEKGLPATKITGKWMFPRRLVEEWLEMNILNLPKKGAEKSADSGILLLAGSDDLLFGQTLTLFHKKTQGIVTFFANLGSMGGLTCLRRGLCHIGVCHLLQDDNREYNFEFAEKELDRLPVFVNFSKREQGILLKKGNPKNIRCIADLARPGVRIINRPLGTGTRLLLDYEIAKSAVSTSDIDGYQSEAARHLDVGLAILTGQADAGPAIRPVAGLLDLDFLPLRWERFDLLVAREHFFDQGVQQFLGLLHDPAFRKLADSFIGYDLSLCGTMVFPDNLTQGE